jgi:hypothetical protein
MSLREQYFKMIINVPFQNNASDERIGLEAISYDFMETPHAIESYVCLSFIYAAKLFAEECIR